MILQKQNRILFQNTVFLKCAKKKKWQLPVSKIMNSVLQYFSIQYNWDFNEKVLHVKMWFVKSCHKWCRLVDQVKSKGICLTIKDYIWIQQKSFLPTPQFLMTNDLNKPNLKFVIIPRILNVLHLVIDLNSPRKKVHTILDTTVRIQNYMLG